ncbi:MAG: discoidin domain-containing protein [Clostridia bacterium]|nr:discoidin domain-containing protein [Clostridia bacterium]
MKRIVALIMALLSIMPLHMSAEAKDIFGAEIIDCTLLSQEGVTVSLTAPITGTIFVAGRDTKSEYACIEAIDAEEGAKYNVFLEGLAADSEIFVWNRNMAPFSVKYTSDNNNRRRMEYLDRGVVAVSTGKSVFVSWRLLADDDDNIGFNVYRTTDSVTTKLNESPLYTGTNFTDNTADTSKNNTYFVKSVLNGIERNTDGEYTLMGNSEAQCITIPIQTGGTIHFVWTGDFNGDGSYDFLVDRVYEEQQKLEAYLNDGTYLWTIDLGYNSVNKNNISPGASTIDVGMWDGVTVYDIDYDGYSEVLLKIADGVTFADGTVYRSFAENAQAIGVINGMRGTLETEAPVPNDYIEIGSMACMMEIGCLDGRNPALICWMKNRNPDKSFNSITVAYAFDENRAFNMLWKYDNKEGFAEAHQLRVCDVDYDGRDEALHMGYAINHDGSLRYKVDGVVHGDRWHVGSFANDNNGNEMMGYGIQQDNPSGLLEYFYNASTGNLLWTNYAAEGTADVGRGNVGDIDPNYDGFECWSFQGLWSMKGEKISDSSLYPVLRLWWDGDLLSESYNDGKIEKWDYNNKSIGRLLSTWKVTNCIGSDRGVPMFYGDILGDWREEVVMTSSDYSKLVILTTTIPTSHRLYTLPQNPCYRNCMTAKGYYQSHMTDYFIGFGMEKPPNPKISVIRKVNLKCPELNIDKMLTFESVWASETPEAENGAENAADGKYETRWAGWGKCDITFDLGSTNFVKEICTTFWKYSERSAFYKVYTSLDAETWQECFSGNSAKGIRYDYVGINKSARYIKLSCNGTDQGEWTSIIDVKAFSK